MHILVTGGCGYKGTVLVPKLLQRGYRVTVVDTLWFGNYLPFHPLLTVLQRDIREPESIPMDGVDVMIHLAAVANDPCGDLDPKLTWEVNALATMQLADRAVRHGIGQFIYASSGSVYGVKEEDQVTEDLSLTPISEYNKTKMVAERVLLSYADQMVVQIIRPATVCGWSPRMRLDVSVNMLTMQALENHRITVFGGSQFRPNIHIQNVTDLYLFMIDHKDRVQGIFNAGAENVSILEIAETIAQVIPSEIIVSQSNDPRSYRINCAKLQGVGFVQNLGIADAIREIVAKYREGILKNDPSSYNLKWMQKTLPFVARHS